MFPSARLCRFALAALFVALLAACATLPRETTGNDLRVSPDGRHFVLEGRPFFWLADTAWELLHRASRQEAELYLEDRRRKGFSVIQTVILAELGGLRVPNANGDLPLTANDPERPNEPYFRYVDEVVGLAEAKGLWMALLPTWGDKFNKKWGEGPEIFTPENARAYGRYLGRRYGSRRVIWILGGDRNPDGARHLAIIREMAEGIRSANGGRQLMTYHPQGWTLSSDFFRNDAWIDFHMFQSGHDFYDLDNYRWTLAGRALAPPKPVLDGEPRYEDHPAALFRLRDKWRNEWFGEYDVRQAAWWSLLSGAAGHTYGNHNIWQMWQPGREPVSKARTPWRQALGHAGAAQMGLMRRFLERHGFGQLEPAQQLLASNGKGAGHQAAARSRDGSYLLVYSPLGENISLSPEAARSMRASWFDPRSGLRHPFRGGGSTMFDPPGRPGRGNDWVLALERRR
jgi:hypothetical protein